MWALRTRRESVANVVGSGCGVSHEACAADFACAWPCLVAYVTAADAVALTASNRSDYLTHCPPPAASPSGTLTHPPTAGMPPSLRAAAAHQTLVAALRQHPPAARPGTSRSALEGGGSTRTALPPRLPTARGNPCGVPHDARRS